MTVMNRLLITAILVMAVLTSCSKDSTSPSDDQGVKNTDTTYFPLKVGYWWDYKGYGTSTIARTSITKEDTINGKSYFVQTSSDISDRPQYFRYENDVVYSIGENNPYGVIKDSEFVYLDFNAPIGTTNVYEGYSLGNPARKTLTLKDKDATYSAANGTVYKDVIEFSIDMDIKYNGSWTDYQVNSYYYAKGVGLVGRKQSGMLTMEELTNYSFK